MSTLLVKNAYIVTMDDHQREIPEGGLFIRRGLIEEVGEMSALPSTADPKSEAERCLGKALGRFPFFRWTETTRNTPETWTSATDR